MLTLPVLAFLAWMPADCRRIKKNLRAAQRGEPRRLWIPLIPAHADADLPVLRIPRLKPRSPGVK
jgi:hypothetical protein